MLRFVEVTNKRKKTKRIPPGPEGGSSINLGSGVHATSTSSAKPFDDRWAWLISRREAIDPRTR
jgi:hypothetical protein